jgi:hypothetical protein
LAVNIDLYEQNSATIRGYRTAMDFFRPRLLHEQEFAMHNRTLPLARQSSSTAAVYR